MLQKAHKLPNGTTLQCDICLVGAGAAGITMALALGARGKSVLLIEAGGVSGDAGTRQLYKGEVCTPAFHQPPDTDRARGLGGTSALWGGRCMPYDPQDFEPRPHIENSGWPFSRDALMPYYKRAQEKVEAGAWAYTTAEAGLAGEMIEGAQNDTLRLDTLERWSPPTHFGKRDKAALLNSRKITVLTGAVAIDLALDQGTIRHVIVKSVRGNKTHTIEAAQVVLCGGGLEVTRLLLHSGIADHSDWLGRGYMSHVGGVIAKLHITPGRKVVFGYEQDAAGVFVRRRLTLSPEAQARHQLPNLYALLDRPLLHDASHNSAVLSAAHLAKRLLQRQSTGEQAQQGGSNTLRHIKNLIFGAPQALSVLPRFGRQRFLSGRRLPSLLLSAQDSSFYLYFHAEQSAHPDARISLSDQRDALGMRRLRIDARLTEQDAEGILRAHKVIGQELETSGAGRLEFLGDDPAALVRRCKSTLGHHIGATRMAKDPKSGVVDPNCKVFGVSNLFVASASALPTSSQAHPTLTVLALALRLCDHLAAPR